MKQPFVALDKIEDLLVSAKKSTPEARYATYAAIIATINSIFLHADPPPSSFAKTKLVALHRSVGAIFGFDADERQSVDVHLAWAVGAIQALKAIYQR